MGAAVAEDLYKDIEEITECDVCYASVVDIDWTKCRVCQKVLCPSCDIRFKVPHKPACKKHCEEGG